MTASVPRAGQSPDAREFCCDQMQHSSLLTCTQHQDCPEDCPDVLVVHSDQHGAGLPVRDGGSSFVTIRFCPWCGAALAASTPQPPESARREAGLAATLWHVLDREPGTERDLVDTIRNLATGSLPAEPAPQTGEST